MTLTQRKDVDTPVGLCDLAGELLTGRVLASYRPMGYEMLPEMGENGLNKEIAGQETEEFDGPGVTLTKRKDLDTPGGLCDLTGEHLTSRVLTSYRPLGNKLLPEMGEQQVKRWSANSEQAKVAPLKTT